MYTYMYVYIHIYLRVQPEDPPRIPRVQNRATTVTTNDRIRAGYFYVLIATRGFEEAVLPPPPPRDNQLKKWPLSPFTDHTLALSIAAPGRLLLHKYVPIYPRVRAFPILLRANNGVRKIESVDIGLRLEGNLSICRISRTRANKNALGAVRSCNESQKDQMAEICRDKIKFLLSLQRY